jgi:GMP synthase (glutamine-hydrolysing)
VKPFLILQLRPEDEAADGEFAAFLGKGGLPADRARRIRLDRTRLPALSLDDYAGVIVGGGPGCVSDPPATKPPVEARIEADILSLMPQITDRDMPFLGCCYGIGILAHHLGAEVSKSRWGEPVGGVDCTLTDAGRADPLLAGLPDRFRALVGHKEAVQSLPPGCAHLLASDPCPFQMIRHGANVYATQFHPEADATVFADRIRIYRDRGYFPPEAAEALTEAVAAEDDPAPAAILRAFVARYG